MGEVINVVKVFLPTIVAFFLGVTLTPILTHYLYKHKIWRKKQKTKALGGTEATVTQSLKSQSRETNTPRMGGVIVWGVTLVTVVLFVVLARLFPGEVTQKLNFLSRNQTWLPLATLVFASLVGFVDDLLVVRGDGGYIGGGIPLSWRIGTVLTIGGVGAWWFFSRLEVSTIILPIANTSIELGVLFVPFFMLVMLAVYSGSVIDGVDGLSGGVLASSFAAYTIIAFAQQQIDLAAFCAVIVGGLLAFLWFNIPPARFYMSETGMLGLTVTLSVVAFLTQQVLVLPFIAFALAATSAGNIIQITYRKITGGKKFFRAAPLHHHFEAIGWSPAKIVMRYWIISVVMATLGVVIALM